LIVAQIVEQCDHLFLDRLIGFVFQDSEFVVRIGRIELVIIFDRRHLRLKLASPKIEAIAKSEGVNIIVDREAVVWADAAVDLTPQLNAQMK
jgi:hypothetical protein